MELVIGDKLSEKMAEVIRGSITTKEITKVAAKHDLSHDILVSVVTRRRNITDNNREAIMDLIKHSCSVNKLEITRRRTNNEYLESFLAETAA